MMQYWQEISLPACSPRQKFFYPANIFWLYVILYYTYKSCHYYSQKIWLLTDLAYSVMMWLLCVRTFALGQS